MAKRTCFVIMGFGEKIDYRTGVKVNLDFVYNMVIKPVFKEFFPEYNVLRNDDIATTGLLDVPMYENLLRADLVIADLTTSNENALYELGIRHAVRPASTILLLQKLNNDKIMFDLSHSAITFYDDLTKSGAIDALSSTLVQLIKECEKGKTDSPLYTLIKGLLPPVLKDDLLIKRDGSYRDDTIGELFNYARSAMDRSDFISAAKYLSKLNEILPGDIYIIQQLALATYKSENPNKIKALLNAEKIISPLIDNSCLDYETLGLAGAIYKKMFLYYMEEGEYKEVYMNKAMGCYKRGYNNSNDYYNGENYANCLMIFIVYGDLDKERLFAYDYLRKETCKDIISELEKKDVELEKWEIATLANCYYHLGDKTLGEKYEEKFKKDNPIEWRKETFDDTKKLIKLYMRKFGI